jgi:hypothetical protein
VEVEVEELLLLLDVSLTRGGSTSQRAPVLASVNDMPRHAAGFAAVASQSMCTGSVSWNENRCQGQSASRCQARKKERKNVASLELIFSGVACWPFRWKRLEKASGYDGESQ